MRAKKKIYRIHKGSALISSLLAVAILLIALIGTTTFRYHAALDGRRAAAQTTAARIALMLCESWRGWQGELNFNPVEFFDSVMTIEEEDGPDVPDGFTELGSYKINLEEDKADATGADYFVTLSWEDEQPGLRTLNATVAWAQRGERDFENIDKTYTLTTYAITP